ncbi:uncharacterized protein LOC129589357 [Paramacrobiotus metropolitanus]|uniref:uncharacterized protein LOC129589357 n=1 Tax=Paramacrobiotus metropolitanus TaxID=2943436 RepID=UPI0024465D34|nr:uncharacterized protein LOC129589357 [Paramacrobiotus metropolitanus]
MIMRKTVSTSSSIQQSTVVFARLHTSSGFKKMYLRLGLLFAIFSIAACAPPESTVKLSVPDESKKDTGNEKPVTFHAATANEQIGIDAPYIFIHPNNQTRPGNFTFGKDLMTSILQALLPVNSTAIPSLENRAKSSQELAPDMLLNNLLTAMIPVLAAASKNDIEIASHQVQKTLTDFSKSNKAGNP